MMSYSLATNLKGAFPFRLGTTSYIFPDDLVPNVRALAPYVDDVEVVLFESLDASRQPADVILGELKALAADHDLTYTIHLPLDLQLGDADDAVRHASVAAARQALRQSALLDPFGYVLHVQSDQRGYEPRCPAPGWIERVQDSLVALLAEGIPSRDLALETLFFPFEVFDPVLDALDLSVCLDVGHVILAGRDPADTFRRYRDRVRVIHLHGVDGDRDHVSLAHFGPEALDAILDPLLSPGPARVVTVEVFDRDILEDSLRVLERRRP